jgi:glycerol-3-phosphate dehydrogenase
LGEGSNAGQAQRRITRDHALLDHAAREGVEGFVTITGGKWTTYRLMADQAADLVCRKLGTQRACRTAETALKGSEARRYWRLGGRMAALEAGEQVVCECELVARRQVEARLAEDGRAGLDDLRRDLRLGMGPCQGGLCAHRAAGMLHQREQMPMRVAIAARPASRRSAGRECCRCCGARACARRSSTRPWPWACWGWTSCRMFDPTPPRRPGWMAVYTRQL